MRMAGMERRTGCSDWATLPQISLSRIFSVWSQLKNCNQGWILSRQNPFFLDKHTCLVEHLQRPLENAKSNIERFIVASDQVYFKTVFFSGFRSGCANTLALTGADLSEIMEHTGWVQCHTALYYQQLAKVLNQSGTSARLAETSVNEVATPWKDTNELEQFVCAFPGATSRKRSHPVELVTLPRGRAAENYRNV